MMRTTVVTVPAETHDLTTLETVKTALRITATTDDDFLALMIAQASARGARYCARTFAKQTVADTFRLDGRPSTTLLLSHRPVVTITSVVEDGTTLSASQYQADVASGLLWRLDDNDTPTFWALPAKIVVTYSAGYILPGYDGRTLPDDLEAAVIGLVTNGWHARGRDQLVKSEKTPDVYEVTYWVAGAGESGDLPPDVETTLSRHMDYPV